MSENTLKGKLLITGTIKVKTGLAIGGNKSGIDIGALDNPVIKYKKGNKSLPYIPGSSLKGKLRALLAKVAGTKDENADKKLQGTDSQFKHLAVVFGYAPDKEDLSRGEALLKVRDCFLGKNAIEDLTEEKMENSINRITGKANPRPLERVLPDTVFDLDLCLDVYNEKDAKEHLKLLDLAFQLLNQDYLGGGGSRGNGRVEIKSKIEQYLEIDASSKKLVSNQSFKFQFTCPYEEENTTAKTQ